VGSVFQTTYLHVAVIKVDCIWIVGGEAANLNGELG